MVTIKRTNSEDPDFQRLVKALDADLAVRDGAEHAFYAQFNKIDMIKNAVVAFVENEAGGCGAVKEYDEHTMEIKRMYVQESWRGKGIASSVLNALELWSKELGYRKCVLETGKKQPEAIALYTKSGYKVIPNYGQYTGVDNSICFAKDI